jgi:hypothetical protein
MDEIIRQTKYGIDDWPVGWRAMSHIKKDYPYEGEDVNEDRGDRRPGQRVTTAKDLRKAPRCEVCGWTNDMLDPVGS